jgi:hypothetical protein
LGLLTSDRQKFRLDLRYPQATLHRGTRETAFEPSLDMKKPLEADELTRFIIAN